MNLDSEPKLGFPRPTIPSICKHKNNDGKMKRNEGFKEKGSEGCRDGMGRSDRGRNVRLEF